MVNDAISFPTFNFSRGTYTANHPCALLFLLFLSLCLIVHIAYLFVIALRFSLPFSFNLFKNLAISLYFLNFAEMNFSWVVHKWTTGY